MTTSEDVLDLPDLLSLDDIIEPVPPLQLELFDSNGDPVDLVELTRRVTMGHIIQPIGDTDDDHS